MKTTACIIYTCLWQTHALTGLMNPAWLQPLYTHICKHYSNTYNNTATIAWTSQIHTQSECTFANAKYLVSMLGPLPQEASSHHSYWSLLGRDQCSAIILLAPALSHTHTHWPESNLHSPEFKPESWSDSWTIAGDTCLFPVVLPPARSKDIRAAISFPETYNAA